MSGTGFDNFLVHLQRSTQVITIASGGTLNLRYSHLQHALHENGFEAVFAVHPRPEGEVHICAGQDLDAGEPPGARERASVHVRILPRARGTGNPRWRRGSSADGAAGGVCVVGTGPHRTYGRCSGVPAAVVCAPHALA